MKRRTIWLASAVTGAALVLGGTAIAFAGTGGISSTEAPDGTSDVEVPITGDALEQAIDAALAATGGGTVTGTEVGDEESMYEIEVTLANGSQVDVQLDASFNVVSNLPDVETDE